MAAYRPLGTFPQYFLADGTVNNGGLITFYETDLTTLKNTYSDEAMTTLNSNPVVMDSAGRPNTDIWGSGAYGVVITDSLGANPRTLNNIQPDSGAGATIPTLVSGDFLTNNGSVMLWDAISQLPDPTGHAGNIMYTDGTLNYWGALPANSATGVAGAITVGVVLIQYGTGSAPSSGLTFTSSTVTFPTAFSSIPVIAVQPTTTSALNNGWMAVAAPLSAGTTGFTATFDSNSGFPTLGNFTSAQPFNWIAIGLA